MRTTTTTTMLLLCLTATAFTAVVPDGECCADCLLPFAQEGRKRKGENGLPKVSTFTTPSADFTTPAADASGDALKNGICGKYWTDNGAKTCCNQGELAKRADALKKRVSKRFHRMLHVSIKKGHGKYKKDISEAIETLQDTTVQQNIIQNSAADTENENVVQADIDEAIKMMQDIVAKKTTEEDDEKKGKEKFKACAKTYGDSQISNMCFDCSVKVGAFYDDAANNLKISKEWCAKVTTDCAGLFGVTAQNMALDRLLRLMNNYMDKTGTKLPLPKRGVKKEADFKMLGDCAADPAACAADDTKRKAFCGFMSLRDDNTAIFGDGEDGNIEPKGIKGRKPGSSSSEETNPPTRRLLTRLNKAIRRVLAEINEGFVVEDANGLKLETITSGAEFLESELPSDTEAEESGSGKIVGSIATILFLIGALLF